MAVVNISMVKNPIMPKDKIINNMFSVFFIKVSQRYFRNKKKDLIEIKISIDVFHF